MHLRAVALASVLVAVTGAVETHGGFKYETRFSPNAAPETKDIKTEYETAAAGQAYACLKEQIKAKNIASHCLTGKKVGTQPAALYALKDCVATDNESNFFSLFSEDIDHSNAFWAQVVSESTSDRTQWKPARAFTKGYFNGSLTAPQFAAWTLSHNADLANLHANPEHYYKATKLDLTTGAQSSEILEGWGGVLSKFGTKRTNFSVPAFATPVFGTPDTPAAWDIGAAFALPLQRVGSKVLISGTREVFGVLHIAVRDFAAGEAGTSVAGLSGIEIYSAVWYPPWNKADAADQAEFVNNYLADEAHHMVVEVVNLSLQAHEDCKSGACVLPFSI